MEKQIERIKTVVNQEIQDGLRQTIDAARKGEHYREAELNGYVRAMEQVLQVLDHLFGSEG